VNTRVSKHFKSNGGIKNERNVLKSFSNVSNSFFLVGSEVAWCSLPLAEFMRFSVVDEAYSLANKSIEHFHPKLVWAQTNEQFSVLSACMVKIFCGPASAAGVERNHKVSANVHTALRNRMGSGKVERQVAVAHNAQVISRGAPQIRQKLAT
jgi:hypothetical protein